MITIFVSCLAYLTMIATSKIDTAKIQIVLLLVLKISSALVFGPLFLKWNLSEVGAVVETVFFCFLIFFNVFLFIFPEVYRKVLFVDINKDGV